MMDRKRLLRLRAEHGPDKCGQWRGPAFAKCEEQPCEPSQILDLALTCFDPEFGVAKVVELKDEAERLRADLERLARETMGITAAGAKAYAEAERLEEKWKAFDSLRVEAMTKADAWREEAERLRTLGREAALLLSQVEPPQGHPYSWQQEVEAWGIRLRFALAGTEATIEREEDWEDGFDE
jgi:hypothetical protein